MSAETEVFTTLSGHPALTAIVGGRIYPDVLPEKTTYPALVFSRETTTPIFSVSGNYFGAEVIAKVGCWGTKRSEADTAGSEAEQALIAAGMVPTGKTSGYDQEADLYATVLTVDILEQP